MITWTPQNKNSTAWGDVNRQSIFTPFVAENEDTYLVGASETDTLVISDGAIFTNVNKS